MIAATILPLAGADGDPKRAIALASILAIMVAAIMIVGAVSKLGFIADLISKPTMIGYMNGLALTILIGQLPKLFGFKVSAESLIGEVAGFVKGLAHGVVERRHRCPGDPANFGGHGSCRPRDSHST
jgi:MFS superfamily sulfate permease-like transporter